MVFLREMPIYLLAPGGRALRFGWWPGFKSEEYGASWQFLHSSDRCPQFLQSHRNVMVLAFASSAFGTISFKIVTSAT